MRKGVINSYNYQNKMDNLCQDVQIIVFSYLSPEEIMVLYDSYKTMIDELSIHNGFVVHCKHIVNDDVILWFQEKGIQFILLKEYKNVDGVQCWYQNGQLHRDNDLPAIIYANGEKVWYQNDQIHRDNDLPAVIYVDGSQFWCQNGQLHRDNDLPAIIHIDGRQSWYKNGLRY